jgi:uncharacterized protein (DUF302 family)
VSPTRASRETAGVVTTTSPHSVGATVTRLQRIIAEKGLKLFAVIDHSGEAAQVGLAMPDTKLVVFGSPTAGTPVMVAEPLAALDLPLKILVWADTNGATSISYNAPSYLAERYHLTPELRKRLEPIEAISDSVIAPDA